MKEDRETCSTVSSFSGIYKNILNKSPTPICMFYFSHPFGISTPSSSANNVGSAGPTKKASKYTTTTYLVTEIEKNHSDGSQDEIESKKPQFTDRELIPWPKNFLLPPLIQLIEKKHGKKLPDIDAILRQVRKQAWNTPKSHHSHNFWSRGSSISSDDFSSLASPDSVSDKANPDRVKLRKQSKNTNAANMEETFNPNGSNGSGRGKGQLLLKRRYSVPEIIMRKYSLAQQKSSVENTAVYSTTSPMSEAITKSSNGQSSINKQPLTPAYPATTSNTRSSSPIKYFIPLSPQPTMSSSNDFGDNGSFLNNEISMRKQTLLRRMWSREFQQSKYSGSCSPPLRRSTQPPQNRLQKFNTLPETVSSSCEKCKELGVLARTFDEEFCEAKEDKSQQTDFDLEGNTGQAKKNSCSSPSSGASTIIHSADVNAGKIKVDRDSIKVINNSTSGIDSNGNNIVICMTTLQEHRLQPHLQGADELLRVEIDSNNNSGMMRGGEKFLRKQFSTQIDNRDTTDIDYKRLREDNIHETEIDEYISQMLIENLNTVIKTVNENLQANGEHNLVKIDYHSGVEKGGEGDKNGYYNNNNKFGNQHEISIQMRNARNGDTTNNRNSYSNELTSPNYIAVERDICETADGKSQSPEVVHFYACYGNNKGLSQNSFSDEQQELTAIINSGTSYPEVSNPESIYVPRFIGPKTESMEVNPSSSSAQEDDEFDGVPDSDDDDISDVDSLDDIVSIRAKRLSDLAHHQHRKAQALFRQTHLKGQAFFVPIVDGEQPIDEHIIVADTMPEKLKEKLILRQRRRDMKKQSEMKIKQWRMQKFIERKMGEVKLVNNYIEDFATTNGAFKIIGMPSKKLGPIETNVYKREMGNAVSGGWVAKPRQAPSAPPPSDPLLALGKSAKSKKLRTEIGMLESYKIDGRGNMQIQNPGNKEKEKEKEKAPLKPKIRRTVHTDVSEIKKLTKTKSKTPSDLLSRKSISSSRPTSNISSASEAIDARRRQVMIDVQQMSISSSKRPTIYKNAIGGGSDLTPDPDSGPSRKMWKTEIQEGDKHIEILEIVECVDGTSSSHQQMAPEHTFSHLFPPSASTSTQNHKYYHVSSSSSTHPTIVNKTFSVKTSGFGALDGRDNFPSKIPIPVYRYMRPKQPFMHYEPRDSSPSNNNYSSSTDAEESLTSAGSSGKQSSKVDRMIANLLMEALKSPDDLGVDFVKSPKMRKPKRRSPAGADSSSTGYYTGDSSSRRSASNSAGKYQHRFEVIPEEKSSFSVDSSNDDFIEDEEEENEKINNINSDWKNRKNLQNNDIKTRSVTPKQEKEIDEEENEKIKTQNKNQKVSPSKVATVRKSPTKNHLKPPTATIPLKPSPAKTNKSKKSNKTSSSGESSSAIASPEKKDVLEAKSFTTFSENCEEPIENDYAKSIGEESLQPKSEDTIQSPHPEHTNLIHQFMSNKSSTSSSNNHFHYHLYQYQTHNCCFNLFDHSKTSSTVTTAASNENYSSFHTQSIENSQFTQSRNTQNCDDEKSKTATSSKFNENNSRLTSSSSEIPSMIFNIQNKVNSNPSLGEENYYDESASKSQTAEKVIKVEISNEDYRKPEADENKCSCTKKYLPYKVNEKNVWQVYETSDCKYIQSKYEIDEIFQPPPSSEGTKTPSEYNPMLHSRSNFSNQIICHVTNHDTNHSESAQENSKREPANNITPLNLNSTNDSSYTPSFNIKSEDLDSCQCIDEESEDNASKVNEDEDDSSVVSKLEFPALSQKESAYSKDSYQVHNKQSVKLLNRPKATNNISRAQVKPIEKEVKNEITKNGVKAGLMKTSKPVRLPSPVSKRQASHKNYEDESESTESDFSSIDSQQILEKENIKSLKIKSNQHSPKDENARQQSSLVRQESKTVIPNIHQGWSVTVAGTHPDLAPDVEMKLSFPKAKNLVSTPENRTSNGKHENPEVFYYRNNQLLQAPMSKEMQYDRYDHKPYYNHRRSLSLARIESMIKPKSYNLPNLHMPRPTARNAFKVTQQCTTISASKTIVPNRRSLSLDVGNRRLSLDSISQASPFSPNDMLSVVGSEIKKTLKPKVKTMSEKDLTKRHLNCFTRSNGHF